MLHGVLRMPPELWGNDAMDVMQRHSRCLEASDRIYSDEKKILELEKQIQNLKDDVQRLENNKPRSNEILFLNDVSTELTKD
ncbi:hypothetical protein N9M08_07720 [Porticoccaceae bacterium]|nr:hypothetical protein [Porticoccaceae bacterium]